MAESEPLSDVRTLSAHYISGTHWDREWYRPLQEFRLLLVELIDELLELMETREDFRYFQLDGQTCVLQDYLDVRPENRERLAKLISDGRILIGPWYTMPDLFCVGDEALVRNLLLGRKIAHEWGVEPMPVGFICDMFGHPSQMPQIFAGFGYDQAVLGRGTNEHTTPMFFTWESPDGSRVFSFKLQDSQGYGAFAVPRGALESETFITKTMTEMNAAIAATAGDPVAEKSVREKWFRQELKRYVDHEIGRANSSTICLMDSMDHIMPATDVARYLRLIEEACPTVKPAHSTLPQFFAEARRTTTDLPVRRGELREPGRSRVGYLYLIPFCVSARIPMKQANDAAQSLLERWAEPWMAIANTESAGLPARYLRLAWEQLLLNHAHDSICGCSIDQVHRDMMYRFDQARGVADQLRQRALGFLTRDCADLARAEHEFTLTIANPLTVARREVLSFDVDLPPDYPATFREGFTSQLQHAFRLELPDGTPVPYQRLSKLNQQNERSRYALPCFQSDGEFTRYRVAAELDLPGLGFTSLRVVPSPTPVRLPGSLRTGPAAAANDQIAIAIERGGTLTLTDLTNGQVYTDLLTFEDCGEDGDGWFHVAPANSETVLSSAGNAQVAVVHDGPLLVTFRVTVAMSLPRRLDLQREAGTPERVELRLDSLVTLRRHSRMVEVETSIDNRVQDHRLRVLLPTDATEASHWWAHHPYDFVRRSIAIDPKTADWQEMEVPEKPFLGAQAVGDQTRGLAFIGGGGLHEGGVADDARRTLHVTLLRAFRRTIATGGEVDGQEQGLVTTRYGILPYDGALPRQSIAHEWARLGSGTICRQTGKRPSGFPPMAGDRPSVATYLRQHDQRLVVSACKPAEDGRGLILRLWNPDATIHRERLSLWRTIRAASYCELNEDPADRPAPALADRQITVEAAPHQVITVRIEV